MLDVNVEKILPVTEVRDSLNKIIDDVESTDELYVVTKNGKPAAIVVGVHHLEKLTGISHAELIPEGFDAQKEDLSNSSAPADASTQAINDTASTATDDTTANSALPDDNTSTNSTVAAAEPAPSLDTFKTPDLTETSAPSIASTAAPATPEDNQTSAAALATNTGEVATSTPDDEAEDIFGPIEEPEMNTTPESTPAGTASASAAMPVSNTPTLTPTPAPAPLSQPAEAATPNMAVNNVAVNNLNTPNQTQL